MVVVIVVVYITDRLKGCFKQGGRLTLAGSYPPPPPRGLPRQLQHSTRQPRTTAAAALLIPLQAAARTRRGHRAGETCSNVFSLPPRPTGATFFLQ